MIQIFTDSCSDLSQELIDQFQIHVVPLHVLLGDQDYQDGISVSLTDLFDYVTRTETLPKTAAPSILEFESGFRSVEGDIICITISSKLSATYQNAILAAEQFPDRRIHVIDSANLSTGIGLLVIRAAELRNQGIGFDAIVEKLTNAITKVHTSFIIDTLEYLYMGGRCSAMQNIVGSLLKLRPVIEVRPDGTLGVKEKIRGSRIKGLNSMLDEFRSDLPDIELKHVFVTHTGCDDDALYLRNELLKCATIENVHITHAGATVGSHCGPNTIGILYFGN
jgi:DegV family protein with EDD domain